MAIFSEDELRKMLNKDIQGFVSHIGTKIEDKLRQNTEQYVYSKSPKVYERTYGLLNSISNNQRYMLSKNNYNISVFFDFNKMSQGMGYYNYRGRTYAYGKHRDAYGNDIRDSLVGWIENGTENGGRPYAYKPSAYGTGSTQGRVGLHRYPARQGAFMLKRTSDWTTVNLSGDFLKSFSSLTESKVYFEKY